MDFMTNLLISEGCSSMVVLTNRLSKGVIADGLLEITAEAVADWFLQRYYPHYFLPRAIVSDRGTQFTSTFWKRIYDTLEIQRWLNTSFSPETDRSTERANKVVQTILWKLVDWSQDAWMEPGGLPVWTPSGRQLRIPRIKSRLGSAEIEESEGVGRSNDGISTGRTREGSKPEENTSPSIPSRGQGLVEYGEYQDR
jgi:hypothetical protein